MSQAPDEINPETIKKMAEYIQSRPMAGKIESSKLLNQYVQSLTILNRSDSSTISNENFIKLKEINPALYIVSETDCELLFLIQFNVDVDLDSIVFYCANIAPNKNKKKSNNDNNNNDEEEEPEDDDDDEKTSMPKTIHIIKPDNLNKDFEDMQNIQADYVINLDKNKLSSVNGHNVSMKDKPKVSVKFSKLSQLIVFFKSNQENVDKTYINGIRFIGTTSEKTDMSKWDKVAEEAKKKMDNA